jgi:hypothetical protein
MLATADPSAVNVTGTQQIGTPQTTVRYLDAPTVAYSLAMIIQPGDTLTLDMESGAVTGTVAGTAQVETATIVAASGATTAGNLNVTVTSALVTGSPLTIPVALLLTDDTAAKVATKVRAALNATAAITAHYTVGGTGDDYTLTTSAVDKAENDSTLNLAHANATSAGITAATTSTNTTAGVGTTRAYKFNGTAWDATDFEGKALPTMSSLHSILIRSSNTAGSVAIENSANVFETTCPFVILNSSPDGVHPYAAGSVDFTGSSAPITLLIDVHAGI